MLILFFRLKDIFSIFFAGLSVLIKDGERVWRLGFFHGFDAFTFFIALVQASGGIIVGATIKYADNILKTFSTAISIVLSCILSYWLLGDLNLAPTFPIGTIIIIVATILYSRASNTSVKDQENDLQPIRILQISDLRKSMIELTSFLFFSSSLNCDTFIRLLLNTELYDYLSNLLDSFLIKNSK